MSLAQSKLKFKQNQSGRLPGLDHFVGNDMDERRAASGENATEKWSQHDADEQFGQQCVSGRAHRRSEWLPARRPRLRQQGYTTHDAGVRCVAARTWAQTKSERVVADRP